MPITTINPPVEIVMPVYVDGGTLSGNIEIFKKRLHRLLLVNQVKTRQYNMTFTATGIKIEFSGANQTEQDFMNQLSRDQKEFADTLGDEISALFNKSKKKSEINDPAFPCPFLTAGNGGVPVPHPTVKSLEKEAINF